MRRQAAACAAASCGSDLPCSPMLPCQGNARAALAPLCGCDSSSLDCSAASMLSFSLRQRTRWNCSDAVLQLLDWLLAEDKQPMQKPGRPCTLGPP